jgi:hypothetical protein
MTWITPLLVSTSVPVMAALRPRWSVMASEASTVKVCPAAW